MTFWGDLSWERLLEGSGSRARGVWVVQSLISWPDRAPLAQGGRAEPGARKPTALYALGTACPRCLPAAGKAEGKVSAAKAPGQARKGRARSEPQPEDARGPVSEGSCSFFPFQYLARIMHKLSAASAKSPVLPALRFVGLLDVLHEYACGGLGRDAGRSRRTEPQALACGPMG